MVISRIGATKMAREEVAIMVAMVAIINLGAGMIKPVGDQREACSYPGY